MTNFEYYKTKESAIEAYSKKESIFNIHEGVSVGRFISWLYKEYDEEKELNEENLILEDWLEFQFNEYANEKRLAYVNIKRSEISEVIHILNEDNTPSEKWSRIVMKNGRNYIVYMPYEKVMELV